MTFRHPPQLPISLYHTPEQVITESHAIVGKTRALLDHLVKTISLEEAGFANVLIPLADDENMRKGQRATLKWYSSTAVTKERREAGHASDAIMQEFDGQTLMREDLFALIDAVLKRGEELDAEDQLYLEKKHAAFKRNGLGLSPSDSSRLIEIKKRQHDLSIGYRQELNATAGTWMTREELEGFPERLMAGLENNEEGKLFLPFRKPHLENALKSVKSQSARRRIYIENDNRCLDNVPRLKETILLRDEAARLLGYANHAAFKMEEKMIKSKDFIDQFMGGLQERLAPISAKAIATLFKLKKDTLGDNLTADENCFYVWDHPYYNNLTKATSMKFDDKKFAEYFELYNSLEGMMATYSQLFGVEFCKIEEEQFKEFGQEHVMVIHESVMVYSVWNDEELEGEFLGYLYLDLFPRPDKFNHAGHYSLQPGFTKPDGSRHYPSAALVMNLQSPMPGKPSLLNTELARSMFHELGHAIHNLTSKTRYACFHGPSSASRDFAEIPSIFLENWLWDSATLKRMGCHFSYLSDGVSQAWNSENSSQPSKVLPDEIITQLLLTRHLNAAIAVTRQCYISAFDMRMHSPSSREELETLDVCEQWNRLMVEITGMRGGEVNGNFDWGAGCARFGMFMRGYDAGCYSYALGKALAQDMYTTMFAKNPMDREVALRYRKTVLEPGSSREGMVIMGEFLGREPNAEARYKELGMSV